MKPHSATTVTLTESELDEIRTLIEQRSAILFDASRERFFSTRIREYLEEKEIAGGRELLQLVKGSSTEYEALLERLLTQETSGKTLLAGAKRFFCTNSVCGLDGCDEHTANAGRSFLSGIGL